MTQTDCCISKYGDACTGLRTRELPEHSTSRHRGTGEHYEQGDDEETARTDTPLEAGTTGTFLHDDGRNSIIKTKDGDKPRFGATLIP